MLINPVNLSYMGGPGLILYPHPGGLSCRGPSRPRLCPETFGDLGVGHHLTETLGSCSRSLYSVRILKAHGLPTSSLHEVNRATVLVRLLYAAPAWRGFATALQDCSRIDRFINRTVNLGYLPAHCQTFNSLVNTAEDRLLSSVIRNSYHVLRPLFPLSSPDGLTSASELIHLPYP